MWGVGGFALMPALSFRVGFTQNLPKISKYNFTAILILVCHLTKMAHFVPCHKEITAKGTVDLFIDNCYKLHGVPKGIVSDMDPRFVGKCWQSFTRKLNTKLNMSTARHPQTDGLTHFCFVNETMQIVLRCYTTESRIDWVSHLPVVEFNYNCSINEASKHSPFEVTYGFQLATPANRLLLLTSAYAYVAKRLTELASVRDFVRDLLTLSKQRMAAHSSKPAPTFVVGDFAFLSSQGLHIHS
jgi:hypothetical protein